MQTFWQNFRYALRMLENNPGVTVMAILTLTLGIGANTAIFTVAYATLLAPLPYPQPNRLVNVWSSLQGHRDNVSPGDFIDWKRQSTAFEELNAWTPYDFNIATQDRPEYFDGMKATEDIASSFRVAMVNEVFANRFLKGVDPLQQHVVMEQVIPDELGEPSNGAPIEWQIVGVFHTVKSPGFREDKPEIFAPFWQMAFPIAGIGVRTAEDPTGSDTLGSDGGAPP